MENCFNCNLSKTLQQSHIIPEFFYKYIYTNDHKFVVVSEDNENKTKIQQKGFREELFCHDCEELLSAKETITAKFFNDIISKNYTNLNAKEISNNILLIEKYNYNEIKKCLLSILWRASISGREEFLNYDLGPYNQIIKKIIFSKNPIPWYKFPIHISKVKLGNTYTSDLLLVHKKGKYKNIHLYSITLAGYNIDYYITEEFENKNFEIYFLNEKFCGITAISLKDLKLNQRLITRFNDSDIVNFYNKHK